MSIAGWQLRLGSIRKEHLAAEVTSTLDDFNSRITALNSTLSQVSDQLTALSSTVSTLGERLTSVSKAVNTLDATISSHTTQLTDLSATLVALSEQFNTTSETLTKQITALDDKLEAVNAQLNSKIDSLEAEVDKQVQTLSTKVSAGYLLINAKNYGVELRIDEGNTGKDFFRVTQGPNGANTLFSVDSGGYALVKGLLEVGGFDLKLGTADQTSRGNTGASRALVKDSSSTLVINYAGDFTGGVRVDGPGMNIVGNLGVGTTSPFSEAYNSNTSHQIAGANSNATVLHIFSPNNAPVLNLQTNKDTDGATMGGIVWTRQSGQLDAHRQIAGIEVVQSGTGAIAGSAMRFWTKASAYPDVRMVIDRNGNVGIGTTSPSYKLDVSGDVHWTGTLRGGTVPWARLSGYPSVNAGTGLTGGGSLSGNVTLNLAPDFIKNFPTGTPSAEDFALIGPSSGSTNYKVPIGPGVNRIPFHAGDGRGVELKGAYSVAHLAGELNTAAGKGRWVRLLKITLDGDYQGARGEIWFGRAHDIGSASSRLGYYVGNRKLPTNEARLALAPGLPVVGESGTGVITDAAIVQVEANTYELWVQVYTDAYKLHVAWHHQGAAYDPSKISYAPLQAASLPTPVPDGLNVQWSALSSSSPSLGWFGRIVQSGVNNNGHYIRYDDGTQIAFHTYPGGAATFTWGYPAAFAEPPVVLATARKSHSDKLIVVTLNADPSATSASLKRWYWDDNRHLFSLAAIEPVHLVAIGRWR